MKDVMIIQDRIFPVHGFKEAGSVWKGVDDELAKQLEAQGFGKIVSHTPTPDGEVKIGGRQRARHHAGQFRADNPATPENEAYVEAGKEDGNDDTVKEG